MIRQRYLKVRLEEYIRIPILTLKTKNLFLRVTKIVLFVGYPKSIKESVLGFSKILQILLIVFNYSGFLRWLSSWFGRSYCRIKFDGVNFKAVDYFRTHFLFEKHCLPLLSWRYFYYLRNWWSRNKHRKNFSFCQQLFFGSCNVLCTLLQFF